ncbi:hypothetical protein DPMN_137886 [Dreissena polymorpha]|uniref:Uncharacterized protein n=1 Tax=Dreissena polymorpha TaxID=45954 RepID=A0A9D4G2T5_DREPO|nr:hypothetical protein DPMN_137886 [Dreissena polymorpha]
MIDPRSSTAAANLSSTQSPALKQSSTGKYRIAGERSTLITEPSYSSASTVLGCIIFPPTSELPVQNR